MLIPNISSIDLLIIVLFMLGTVVFGIWIGRGSKSLDGYLLGGRNLHWLLILGSIIATETSTVTFLSVPGGVVPTENSSGGDFRFLQLVLGYIIGRVLVVCFFLPKFFEGKPYTAYQILRERFGEATSKFSSLLFVVTRTLSDGMRLYLTAIVLEKALGISLEFSILVIGVSTIVYTFFGGMKSVIWNDCIQLAIYTVGAIVAGIVIVQEVGFDAIAEYAEVNGTLNVFVLSWDMKNPYTLLSGLCGGIFLTLATHGTDQLMVQRYLCAKSKRDAGLALGLSGPIVFLQFTLFLLIGLGLATYYSMHQPTSGSFSKGDEVFATFIVEAMPVGIVGLVLAAVFSAAMSTLSSSLSSSATALVNDILRRPTSSSSPTQSKSDSDTTANQQTTTWTRAGTVGFGVLQMGVAIGANWLFQALASRGNTGFEGSVIGGVLTVAGFASGIILGVFFLGVLTKYRADLATRDAMLVGLAAMSVIAFVWGGVAWTWFAIIGSTITFLVGARLNSLCKQSARKSEY